MKDAPLHIAARDGDLNAVRSLVEQGVDVNAILNVEHTPLMAACLSDHVNVARFLLDHGADICTVNRLGYSALHIAAIKSGPEIVRLLVSMGADVNLVDRFGGSTPLVLAAAQCKHDRVLETCAILIAAGAGIDMPRTNRGTTALWAAAIAGRGAVVDFLIGHGANLDIRDHEGKTMLMEAVKLGHFDTMLQKLLSHSADVNAQDMKGRTALMYAVGKPPWFRAFGTMLSRILEAEQDDRPHSDVEMKTQPKRSVEDVRLRAEVIGHLLTNGADRDLRDIDGKTALDLALDNAWNTENGNAEVIDVLWQS